MLKRTELRLPSEQRFAFGISQTAKQAVQNWKREDNAPFAFEQAHVHQALCFKLRALTSCEHRSR